MKFFFKYGTPIFSQASAFISLSICYHTVCPAPTSIPLCVFIRQWLFCPAPTSTFLFADSSSMLCPHTHFHPSVAPQHSTTVQPLWKSKHVRHMPLKVANFPLAPCPVPTSVPKCSNACSTACPREQPAPVLDLGI